jgi:F-type H+-transporting ATPase subunit b
MQIDWWTLALQTVNFLVVVWLLSRFLYRPVRRIIEEREAADRKAADEASKKAEAADAARKDYEEKRAALDDAERERDAAFHAQIEKERDAVLSEAQARAEGLIADARERIERDRYEALKGLREDIVRLAAALAGKALAEVPATAEAAVDDTASHIDGLAAGERSDLKKDLEGNGAQLTLVSAADLPEGIRAQWKTMLEDRFGKTFALSFQTDPELLGGIKLRFPHAQIDFSVASRLDRAAAGTRE